jgi:transcription elongation factor Elf1
MVLSPDELKLSLKAIALRHSDADAVLTCPRCGATGLSLVDRSARPYAEWYQISCRACNLDETVHIPLGPPVMGGYD